MSEVTVIVTSCNRVDLLKRTMESFIKMNTYPVKRIIGHNDGDDRFFRNFLQRFPQIEHWQFSNKRIGYAKSLDNLLQQVDTKYVFTTEDDWLYHQNPGFIERSLEILENNSDIHQVWIRDLSDHGHPVGDPIFVNGHEVRPVLPGYRKIWNGFSLNPGLRRMSDLRTFFPDGLSNCGDGDEATLAQHTAKFNYKAVSIVRSSIKHIGYNRRSINFKP